MNQMKKLYLLILMAVLSFLSSCSDDLALNNGSHNIKEGVPVQLSLNFKVNQSTVVSREASSSTAEQTVNVLYVFVFNNDRTLDQASLFELNNQTGAGEVIMAGVHSGYDKRIYAVANPESGAGSLTPSELGSVKTEDELLAKTSTLRVSTNVSRTYFLMSGKLEVAEGYNQINITEKGVLEGAKENITLHRVDARITFRVKGKNENSKFSDFKFTAERYWVEQIPQSTYVFPNSEGKDAADEADEFASMSTEKQTILFEGVESSGDNAGYNIFEFYMVENRQKPKVEINTNTDKEGAENLYALREKREKTSLPEGDRDPNKPGQTLENGAFRYANDHSTYVVFTGVLSYTDNSESNPKFVNANVTFTVHLGNTGEIDDANAPLYVNNYDTERNTHYTYTVTVTGITSMQVEVKADNGEEQRPGMEGDVIIAGAEVKAMDSHYGRTFFTLRRGDIIHGLSWAIDTPFQRGMKVFVTDNHKDDKGKITESLPKEKLQAIQTDLNLNDYKWVQFVINREAVKSDGNVVPNNEFAKYPGYMAYAGGEGTTTPAPAFGGEGYFYEGAYYSEKVVLYDVNQLINHLYVEANNPDSKIFEGEGDDATVAITAFIDEYVYVYDPGEIYYREPLAVDSNESGKNLQLWKQVVNGKERMLHFCTSSNIYSPDGNTSLAESVITISQKPIYTFYNANDPDVQTAWGTESIMETDRLVVDFSKLSTGPNTNSNGRENTLNIIPNKGNLHWTDVLNTNASEWGHLQDGYNNIWFATLGRNRDLNGDNIVQSNEIRWYLASIDQLTDIWIGQNSLNREAWLYHGDGTVRLHVASSSYHNSSTRDDVWVIWAEEGASRGASKDSNGYNEYGDKFEYRCVRNLGLSLKDIDCEADDYVELTSAKYNNGQEMFEEYFIDVSHLEINSLRSSSVTGDNAELPSHHERQGTNLPYKKFAVLRGISGSDNLNRLYPEQTNSLTYFQNNKVCPRGYRTPNQRELMLMYTSLNSEHLGFSMDWSQAYASCTKFGYNNNGTYSNRTGFLYDVTGNLILETGNSHPSRVRCVRDVVD